MTAIDSVLNHCGSEYRRYAATLVVPVKLSGLRDNVRVEGFLSGTFHGMMEFFC